MKLSALGQSRTKSDARALSSGCKKFRRELSCCGMQVLSGAGTMVRKPWAIALLILAVAVAAAIVITIHTPDPGISATVAQRQPDVSRGQYVYELADCAAATASRAARRWPAASGW
jgi:hypothetical protein